MQMAQPLLSDLCSICHSETPKYRCPRCKTQTCSLPCYKRHQQRAACSGKRDPAAYVKKNDLATPTGVDRDYNYLKGVERTIEDAGRIGSERGIGIEAQTVKRAATSRQPNSAVSKYLERNNITVEYAPTGMSRQKTNHTRPGKGGKILWTVEWIDNDGQQSTRHENDDSASLVDLYGTFRSAKEKAERRLLEEDRQALAKQRRQLKRKRGHKSGESQMKLDEALIPPDVELAQTASPDNHSVSMDNPNRDNPDASQPAQIVAAPDLEGPTDEATGLTVREEVGKTSHTDLQTTSKRNFYLLRTTTATHSHVLVPLNPDSTLTASLQNRTVAEYPTIHVLPEPPEALPKGFILETNYVNDTTRNHASPRRPSKSEDGGSRGEKDQNQAPRLPSGSQLDAKDILDMLKRDIALK